MPSLGQAKLGTMDDKTFAQKKADLAALLQRITDLTEDADVLAAEINEEAERRRDHPGADVREFRPRPSNGPTDQGSC